MRKASPPKRRGNRARCAVADRGDVDAELFGEFANHGLDVGLRRADGDLGGQRRQRQRPTARLPDQRVTRPSPEDSATAGQQALSTSRDESNYCAWLTDDM